ncbi:hypothetical protein [Pontibacter sp. G13]|uniref:hypothetical protein n=1 Tax=Pontibacter sp. G13 TaxID=3074898 RepID=UPI00288B0627|nr:hypothetical protein [Pontibacter sp. G13]WNJ20440.1 hypothetical protein RJD25_08160 [Pontibacter sp. G13]
MGNKHSTGWYMRVFHRYLGYFLAGIMAVYAISGIVLIFRDTDFLKRERQVEKTVAAHIPAEQLGKALEIRKLKVDKQEGDLLYFKGGTYNTATGAASYTVKEMPFLIDKMNHLHKAKSGDPLFFLNIFFGISLLFFVISTFWMFRPKTAIFRRGMYFTLAGIVLTLLLIFL